MSKDISMTSELNNDLRIYGYKEGSYICKCQTCLQPFMGAKRSWSCKTCAEVKFLEPRRPRAVPDVPELVRYRLNQMGELVYSENGQYVLHSQAAEIIASERANVATLESEIKRINDAIAVKGGTEHSPTQDAYNLACSAIEKHRKRAEAAEAKLAQCEAILKDSNAVHVAMLRGDIAKPTPEQINHIYASSAPAADLKAENERLRGALDSIIERSHNDPLGTSKVVDMRNIAIIALKKGSQ